MKNSIIGFFKVFFIAFFTFNILILTGIYIYAHAIPDKKEVLKQDPLKEIKNSKKAESADVDKIDKRVNILLMGIDSLNGNYENNRSRTDTLMLLSLDPETKTSFIFSIPRDSRVTIPGRKNKDKINHAHAYGGPELTVKTVEKLLDIDVNYYVRADYQALFKLVDDVGGVEIDVPMNMVYSDPYATPPLYINIKKGNQILNGEKSMQYLRFRKGYANQDLGRVEAQQKFLKALAKKIMSPSSIINIHKYIKTVNEYTDTNMQLKDMLSIGTSAITYVKPDEIQRAMLIGNPSSISGVSYYIVDEEASKELLKELFEGTHKEIGINEEEEKNNEKTQEIKKAEMLENQTKNQSSEAKSETSENDEPKPLTKEEELKIVVLNGSGKNGMAIRGSDLIKIIGYNVLTTGNADSFDYKDTIIYHKEGMLEDARNIRKILGGAKILQEDKKYQGKNVDILIILGPKIN